MLTVGTSYEKYAAQEQLYLELRKKEGRIYSDTEVKQLPDVPKGHPLANEWKVRKHSAKKLVNALKTKNRPLKILEIGCGNGWLCHQLSCIPHSDITGVDVNKPELEQADRLFGSIPNIRFVCGDIFEDGLLEKDYSVIVFASSIQYFENITTTIERALSLLSNKGEIHIIDTPFYTSVQNALAARQRSERYFSQCGTIDMARYYHHYTYADLLNFNHTVIKPTLAEHLLRLSRFPKILIKNV